MSEVFVHSAAMMGTVVTIRIVGHGGTRARRDHRSESVRRAMRWFEEVTARCSRFDQSSELSKLVCCVGSPIPVSPILFEALRFAMTVARETDGAFDPTVGARMEALGFNAEFRTGQRVATPASSSVTYRDVIIDEALRTVTLAAPMMLDLGAVAKGLAVDLAARELSSFGNFAIDAGGDLYLSGVNDAGEPWSVGVRHPRLESKLLATIRVSNAAVCTSGDYERTNPTGEHHIVDARTGNAAREVASVTVKAPSAIVADALATAAFALGPAAGLSFLESQGVDGFIVTPTLERFTTTRMHVE